MSAEKQITCAGCGLLLTDRHLPPADRYRASGECLELFHQLAGYTLSQPDPAFTHQLVVDAYGAQHAGEPTKNITTVFSLIGLCLAVEHQFTGRQVQQIHMRIPKQEWPRLEAPPQPASMTVQDVLPAKTAAEREKLIRNWAESVWESWSGHHSWIRIKAEAFL